LWLLKMGVAGAILVGGLAGTGWVGWRLTNHQLVPLLQENLGQILERPLKLGQVKGLSWRGIRIGQTIIPPTAEEFTWAQVDAVDIGIDWPALLLERTLRPTVTLIRPEVSIYQRWDGEWQTISIPAQAESQGPIQTKIDAIRLQNGTLSLIPAAALGDRATVRVEEINGGAVFDRRDDQQVAFDLRGGVGKGNFQTDGEARLDTRAVNLALQAHQLPISGVNLFLPPDLQLQSGELNSNLTVKLRPQAEPPISAQGTASFTDGTAQVEAIPQPISAIHANLRFKDQQVTIEDTGLAIGNIPLQVGGKVDWDNGYDVNAQVPEVSLATLQETLGVALPVTAEGSFRLNTQIVGALDQPRILGTLNNRQTVQVDQLFLDTLLARFTLTPDEFVLQDLQISPSAGGEITGQGTVSLASLEDPAFNFSFKTDLPVDALATPYEVALPDQIALGALIADAQISGTVKNPQAALQWQLPQATYPGQGEIFYRDQSLRFQNSQFQVAGGTVAGQGQVNLASLKNPTLDFRLNANVPGDVLAAAYEVALPDDAVIGAIVADAQVTGSLSDPQAVVQWQLPTSTYPGQGEILYRDRRLQLQNTQLRVGDGTVRAEASAALNQDRWQAILTTHQVPVERFTAQAQGRLSGELQLAGQISQLSPAAVQAAGTVHIADARVQLVQGRPSLLPPGDWDARFRWTGDGLQLDRLTAPGVQADGFIAADWQATPPVGPLALNLQVQNLNLLGVNALTPEPVRSQVQLAGLADFNGQVRGTLTNPEIAGQARLQNLAVNDLSFGPDLAGPLQFTLAEGGSVDLQGHQARLAVILDEALMPSFFDVRNRDFLAQGRMVDHRLQADIQNFPLTALRLSPAAGLGPLQGMLDASLEADLADLSDPAASGTVAIREPALGQVQADAFQAQFSYRDGTAALTQGELQLENSRLLLAGSVTPSPQPQFQGELRVEPGQIEDFLAALQWVSLADIERGFQAQAPTPDSGAADLETIARGNPENSLPAQLKAFADFIAQRQAAQQAAPDTQVPPLDQLAGIFTASLKFSGSSAADVRADFDIQGQNWIWGDYQDPNQFVVSGAYRDQTLTLDPARFESAATQVSLAGQGSPQRLAAELRVDNVPAELLTAFVKLPVEVGGQVNAIATLSGPLTNPGVQGTITMAEPSLNQTPLASVGLDFDYAAARLAFTGALTTEESGQLDLSGKIPYALPFMTVQPANHLIDIEVSARNQGLTLLNLVTDDQLRWEGGNGDVALRIGGTLAQPAMAGTATFEDGILSSKSLSQQLTNLTGMLRFNQDRIQVEQLQANVGTGQILIQGEVPVSTQAGPKAAGDGLLITLDQIPVDYEDLLKAQLNGQVQVTGAAVAPVIGGEIQVSQGRAQANQLLVRLRTTESSDSPEAAAPVEESDKTTTSIKDAVVDYREAVFGPVETAAASPVNPLLDKIQLNNFILGLENRFVIDGGAFYYLTASGTLAVNGSLANPLPEGTFLLDSGWINVFSNRFRLVPAEANSITFSPERGLDPWLDVRMSARVQDLQQIRIPNSANQPFPTAEVRDTSLSGAFGDVEYILVDAQALGPASQLFNSLELTSQPARSQAEIIALLSSDLRGIAREGLLEAIGLGFLTGLGDRFGNALGLRSFSVGPTTDRNPDSTVGTGTGVSASFDIGRNFNVGFSEVLNNSNPPQFGVIYRINDQIRTGADSNFSNYSEFFIEYRLRF
jgi:translocation and assembly module TamB